MTLPTILHALVNVWGLMPRLSCDEARYTSQSKAQDILSGA
jgi:hypothetical protein